VPYYLAQQVFFCFTGTYCVFLDIERDQYLAGNRASIEALTPWLSSRACAGGHSLPEQTMPSAEATLATDLTRRGLLTTNEGDGKPFQPVRGAALRSTPPHRKSILRNAVRFPAFYSACHAANRRLITTRTRLIIDFVHNRKRMNSHHSKAQSTKLISLISTFNTLRPFYPRPYLCLFDSLALVEFLATYQTFPTLVFGVRGEPFQAHCWVQHEDLLLNDSVAHVAAFTPIMTV
jgi:hypothetical protein